jgi:hypothetical protein
VHHLPGRVRGWGFHGALGVLLPLPQEVHSGLVCGSPRPLSCSSARWVWVLKFRDRGRGSRWRGFDYAVCWVMAYLRTVVFAGDYWLGSASHLSYHFLYFTSMSYGVWRVAFSRYLDLGSIDLLASLVILQYQSITLKGILYQSSNHIIHFTHPLEECRNMLQL